MNNDSLTGLISNDQNWDFEGLMMKTLMSNLERNVTLSFKRNISLSTLFMYLRLSKYLFFKMLKITQFL